MRIVHVADSFAPDIGGIERQVESLATRQRDEGHDVTVITAVAEPADLDLDVVRAASGRWLTVAFPSRNHKMVADVLDGRPIDVVHAHYTVVSPLAIYVSRAASRRGIPVAITVHSLWWKVALATRLTLLPFGWGRLRAAWSAVSTVAAARVKRTLPRVSEVSVVPNLVETHWWHQGDQHRGAPGDSIQLVLVGRLKKRKHVDEFFDALAQARARLPLALKANVTIVGEGPRRPDLQRQLDELGLADWVTLVGHRDSRGIRSLLHQSDLFIASSRHESFGLAALEARAAGLPVLGYHGNGLSDFIEHGSEGLLVADTAEMADALVALLGDRRALERLRDNTMSSGPSVGVADAMQAVEDLYRRAGRCVRRPDSGPKMTSVTSIGS